MKTTVHTLDTATFGEACRRLEALVSQDFQPDLVVGIREGGQWVSQAMFPTVKHVTVALHRPSTKRKRRLPSRILRSFPYAVLDRMRIWEAKWLNRKVPLPYPEGTWPEETPAMPESTTGPGNRRERILIVDDAVDSGRTLELVARWLHTQRPEAEIRSAVITVTTRHPLLLPEYYLFYPDTLIRFPWSIDNKTAP